MAKQADKKPSFFAGIMSFFSWCAVLLLWASAAGIYLHPALFKWVQLLELAFPLLLGLVALLILCRTGPRRCGTIFSSLF